MQTEATLDTNSDTTCLAVAGDVDIVVAADLRTAIQQALTLGAAQLVVDLTGVTVLDSSGISALVTVKGRNLALAAGVSYRITNPRSLVRRTLEVTGSLGYLEGTADSSGTA